MTNGTYLPKGRDECYWGDCAELLSTSKQELEENTLLLGSEHLGSEQQPLLREEVALSSGQSLMYA